MEFKRKYLKYKYKYLYLKKLENQNCITNNRKQSGGGGHEKYCDICGGPLYCGGFKLNNLDKYQKYFDNIEVNDSNFFEFIENEEKLIYYLHEFGNIPKNILKIKDYTDITDLDYPNDVEGEILKDLNDLTQIKKYKWLNDVVLLHWSGKIIKIKDVDSWENLYIGIDDITYSLDYYGDKTRYGLIMHNDCYQLTKSMYGDYNSLNIWNDFNTNRGFVMKNVNIDDEFGSYNNQDVLWFRYFYLGHDYLLESPLKNKLNKERIQNIDFNIHKEYNPDMFDLLSIYEKSNGNFSEDQKKYIYNEFGFGILHYKKGNTINKNNFEYLKKMLTNGKDNKNIDKKTNNKTKKNIMKKSTMSKKVKNRPSPSESATKFKVGTKKKGNDGNMWVIIEDKNGVKRWKKKNRPSPSDSATKFKLGTKKKGNDGNMWIIVENKNGVKRWSKIK
jgi:hypothetical protein